MLKGFSLEDDGLPFLITFNGDDFDLRYLVAQGGEARPDGRRDTDLPHAQEASLKHGVHIDLYRFFNNRSVQVYVYGNKYADHTLNGISEASWASRRSSSKGTWVRPPLLQLSNYCLTTPS